MSVKLSQLTTQVSLAMISRRLQRNKSVSTTILTTPVTQEGNGESPSFM